MHSILDSILGLIFAFNFDLQNHENLSSNEKAQFFNESPFELLKTPSTQDSMAPNLCSFGDHFVLSWIDRQSKGVASLRIAGWNGKAFGKAKRFSTLPN